MKNATKWTAKFAAIALLAVPQLMFGQVNTTCTTIGNQINCTSVDQGAQNQQAYEAGQQFGNAVGLLIARGIQSHQFHSAIKSQCKQLAPGAQWNLQNNLGQTWSGTCPVPKPQKVKVKLSKGEVRLDKITAQDMAKLSIEDKTSVTAAQFMQKHPEYLPCPGNSKRMIDFMADHVKGDYPTEADYEQAFAILRPSLQLH